MNVWMRLRLAGASAPPARSMSAGAQRASAAIDRPLDRPRHLTDRLGVGVGRDREPGLDDVDAERVELTGQADLLAPPAARSRAPARRRAGSCRR